MGADVDPESDLSPERLVVLDATWAATNRARRFGRAPVGERLVGAVPPGHATTTTFRAALRVGGLTGPLVIDGAVNGDLFVADVEQYLVPALRPGDVVVRDTLSSPKRAGVREAIAGAGGPLVDRPPYRPDLNPIERAFAKRKALRRKAGERTVEGLWAFRGSAVDRLAPPECRNDFRHSGYSTPPTAKPL